MDNINVFDSPEISGIVKRYSPYLSEVRKRFIFTFVVFAAATIVGFLFYEKIIKALVGALSLNGVNIVFTSPFQFINLSIACGVASGLVIVFPLLVFQVFSFLRPALKKSEYKTVVGFLPFSLFLFVAGFIFGTLIMKWQIQIFLGQSTSIGIGNVLDISKLLTTVLLTSALMGVGFQFPIVLLLLLRLGIVKPHQLSKYRPWIYLGAFIFAIILPPDSILADILLTLPFIFLFEFALVMNRILQKK